jgi:hypothetical protein
MLWIGSANFLMHGIPVQKEQDVVKLGAFRMELFTKYEKKKFWLLQSLIFTGSLAIGKTGCNVAEHHA